MGSELDAILSNFETALQDDSSNPIQVEILHLSSADPKTQEKSLREIINYTLDERNREFITDRDGIAPVITLLNRGAVPIHRVLAAHALANLALTAKARNKIRVTNGISALLSALNTNETNLKERCLAALANLTIAEDDIRMEVINQGGASTIISTLNSTHDVETIRTGLMVIANLGVNGQAASSLISSGAVEICANYLTSSDTVQKRYALWACAALSSQPAAHSKLQSRLSDLSFPLRDGGDSNDVIKALTIFVNVSGNESAHSQIVNMGLVPMILRYLTGSEVNAKVLTLQIVQNVALSDQGRRALLSTGQARAVLTATQSLNEPLVAHGLRAITNLTQEEQIRQIFRAEGGVQLAERYLNSYDGGVKAAAELAHNNLSA